MPNRRIKHTLVPSRKLRFSKKTNLISKPSPVTVYYKHALFYDNTNRIPINPNLMEKFEFNSQIYIITTHNTKYSLKKSKNGNNP